MPAPMPLPSNAIECDGTPLCPVIEPVVDVVPEPVVFLEPVAPVDMTVPGIYVGGVRQPNPAPQVETS